MSLTRRYLMCGAAALAGGLLGRPAFAQDDFSRNLINKPDIDSWNIYGKGETHKFIRDKTVAGEAAFRVTVPGVGDNPYDIGIHSDSTKAVKKDDVLFVTFYARAQKTPPDAEFISFKAMIQMANPTYTPLIAEEVHVTSDWKPFYLSARAPADYFAGQINVSLQVATGKQILDLGPVMLFDLGPVYNIAQLPGNN